MEIISIETENKSFLNVNLTHLFTRNIIPVAIAGMIDRIIFHPMETVITFKQDNGQPTYTIVKNLLHQGYKTFYPGYVPSVVAAIPIRVSIFSTYAFIKEQGQYTSLSPVTIMLIGGITTGLVESAILCPIDTYRTQKTLLSITQNNFPIKTLFKGFTPLFMRTSIENTVCLVGSDYILKLISPENKHSSASPYISGFFSGFVSQFFSTPFDVIKTRCMKEPDKSLKTSIKALIKEGGLFRSTSLKANRAGICNAMVIGTSNFIKNTVVDFEVKTDESVRVKNGI